MHVFSASDSQAHIQLRNAQHGSWPVWQQLRAVTLHPVCFTAASCQASGGVFAGYTVLHHAVAGGNIEIVNTLLRTGHATPDTESSRNRITPLHVAAKHGRVVLLPVLMQAGYKAQAITSDGK